MLVAAMAATDESVTLAKMVRSESSGRVISMTGGSSSGSVVGESAVVDMRPRGSARVGACAERRFIIMRGTFSRVEGNLLQGGYVLGSSTVAVV